jgi:hypothetical protein
MSEPTECRTYAAEWWETIPQALPIKRAASIRPPGFEHLSLEEYVVFLETQIAGAVGTLRQRDETERTIAERYSARMKLTLDHVDKEQARQRDSLIDLQKSLGAAADRYNFIREHQVQIWALGIAATGDNLDQAIDDHIAKHRSPPCPPPNRNSNP